MTSRSTSDLRKALDDISDFAGRLDPDSVNKRVVWWRKYGLPGSSLGGDGSRSSETPLPVSDGAQADGEQPRFTIGPADATDRRLESYVRDYRRAIDDARSALDRATRVQNAIVNKPDPMPETIPFPCANLACTNLLEEGRVSGCCVRCRVWEHRHGTAYPQQRAETA